MGGGTRDSEEVVGSMGWGAGETDVVVLGTWENELETREAVIREGVECLRLRGWRLWQRLLCFHKTHFLPLLGTELYYISRPPF